MVCPASAVRRGAWPHRESCSRGGPLPGHRDDLHARRLPLQGLDDFDPFLPLHHDVSDDEIWGKAPKELQPFPPRLGPPPRCTPRVLRPDGERRGGPRRHQSGESTPWHPSGADLRRRGCRGHLVLQRLYISTEPVLIPRCHDNELHSALRLMDPADRG